MDDINALLKYGLNLAGFSVQRIISTDEKTNLSRFVSFYGVSPVTCSETFDGIRVMCREKDMKIPKRLDMFLMCLCWMKTHATERMLAGTFNVIEKTVHKWLRKFASFIQALKEKKVRIFIVFYVLKYLSLTHIYHNILHTDYTSDQR